MSKAICLNADLGELPGPEGRALDAALLAVVTRCNVACGGHAGDAASMRETIVRAKACGVQIGAHPSYPDRDNFGRLSLALPAQALGTALDEQVAALAQIAQAHGAVVAHLKAHGALYNDAAKDPALAGLVAAVTRRAGIAELVGPPQSALQTAAQEAGLIYIAEGFADRTYEADGALTPRRLPGAVRTDVRAIEAAALAMALNGTVTARTGECLALGIRTLCLHSDTPGAASHGADLRAALEAAGLIIAP